MHHADWKRASTNNRALLVYDNPQLPCGPDAMLGGTDHVLHVDPRQPIEPARPAYPLRAPSPTVAKPARSIPVTDSLQSAHLSESPYHQPICQRAQEVVPHYHYAPSG